MKRKTYIALLAAILASAFINARPQQQQVPKAKPTSPTRNVGAYDWFGRFGLVCSGGSSYAATATKPTAQCGGILSGPFFDLEVGAMGPQAAHSTVSGYFSANSWLPLSKPNARRGFPLVQAGYTRMFETGSAFDYGLAYAYPLDGSHSIQFEARDYWIVADPQQHNVVLRIVWLTGLPD